MRKCCAKVGHSTRSSSRDTLAPQIRRVRRIRKSPKRTFQDSHAVPINPILFSLRSCVQLYCIATLSYGSSYTENSFFRDGLQC